MKPSPIRVNVKLYLALDSGSFFGPGTAELLECIEEAGSVRLASERMGMSYSKAWKLIAEVERQLGMQIVARRQGGAAGGNASVTDDGLELVRRFRLLEARSRETVGELFREIF